MSDKLPGSNIANELARERNREAADRTLMAWIRTALALIGFGFGIGKIDDYLRAAGLHARFALPHGSLIFGASFIVVGILGLLAAIVQHSRVLKRLSRPDFGYDAMRPIAMIVAALLVLIGVCGDWSNSLIVTALNAHPSPTQGKPSNHKSSHGDCGWL